MLRMRSETSRSRRVAPVSTAPMDSADVNWCNVLAHHAGRTPDKVLTIFEGEATTYKEMARRVAALGRRSG